MEISRHWRLRKTRYGTARGGLVGEICPDGHLIFPPRDLCPECADAKTTTGNNPRPYEFSGQGEVYSYTTIYDAPEGFEGQAPYTVALVRLIEEDTEGQRIDSPLITAMLTDLDVSLPSEQRVAIGQPVEMVTRKLSEDGPLGQITFRQQIQADIGKATRFSARRSVSLSRRLRRRSEKS